MIQVYENVPLMNSILCIQNSKNAKYMHADNVANGDGQRQIFRSKSNQLNETFNFAAEFLDRGRALRFKNVQFEEYLYSVNCGGDASSHIDWETINGLILWLKLWIQLRYE